MSTSAAPQVSFHFNTAREVSGIVNSILASFFFLVCIGLAILFFGNSYFIRFGGLVVLFSAMLTVFCALTAAHYFKAVRGNIFAGELQIQSITFYGLNTELADGKQYSDCYKGLRILHKYENLDFLKFYGRRKLHLYKILNPHSINKIAILSALTSRLFLRLMKGLPDYRIEIVGLSEEYTFTIMFSDKREDCEEQARIICGLLNLPLLESK